MTARKHLTPEERRRLLIDMASIKSDDDDAVTLDPKWFLPLDTHSRALRLETLVVRGGRGAGKSALFHFLGHTREDPTLLATVSAASVSRMVWLEGFSGSLEHPSRDVIGEFSRDSTDDSRRHFWLGWLCAALSKAASVPLPKGALQTAVGTSLDPRKIATAAHAQLTDLSAWLDGVERLARDPYIVTYDGLDRIGGTTKDRNLLTSSLLAMWLSLADRYRKIRPKVFVREDLFQASLSAFPDASKLDARSVSIEWRVEDLYRVLLKHMANISDPLREWIEGSSRGIPFTLNGALGWTPPAGLPEQGRQSQKGFVDHLAGELMGSGLKKGLTYRWIPNRLQDAYARIVPRSILSLIRNAASFAVEHGPQAQSLRLLTPIELQGALGVTSRRRVAELTEEFPLVQRLTHLRGRTVMLQRKDTIVALSRPAPDKLDEYGNDGERVLATLIELGVMSERPDGRIDVPDIYRYGFEILRKGGVKRPR